MQALGKDARRLFELSKGSFEPSPLAKTRIRDRLDTKIAAMAALGATGLVSKISWAGMVIPSAKTLIVSLVLVGAAGVGYATAPVLRLERTRPLEPQMAVTQRATSTRIHSVAVVASAFSDAPGADSTPVAPEPTAALVTEQIAHAPSPRRPTEFAARAAVSSQDAPAGSDRTDKGAEASTDGASANPLEEETRLMREAHQAILRGNSAEALRLLQLHQSRFPAGVMRQERDAARIVANCRLGQNEQAREQWTQFTANWPGSPLADRIRANCHWPEQP